MSVIHVLKDGTRLTDITGHVVKMEDVPDLYDILKKFNRRLTNETRCNTLSNETLVQRT